MINKQLEGIKQQENLFSQKIPDIINTILSEGEFGYGGIALSTNT